MSDQLDIKLMSDLLATLRLSAKVLMHVSCCGTWNLSTSGSRKCPFHLVARGACLMHFKDRPPERLEEGDLVVLPREGWHDVCGLPALAAEAGQPGASIMCGYFEFGEARANPMLDALPDMVLVRAHQRLDTDGIVGLVRLIAAEAEAKERGGGFVLDKLAEALFAMVVRAHLQGSGEKRGFMAALADPRLARALAAIHREPHRGWHVDTLAEVANMSRTAFASKFAETVGLPPAQYLAECRMRRASDLLRDPRYSVDAIAARSGYRSQAAFRRAFKRLQGRTPGALRRAAAEKT